MDMELLSIPLPEDILKLKLNGNFSLVKTVIYNRLNKDLPERLKDRLRLELELLDSFQEEFIYTKEEAIHILKENIIDFHDEEFDELFIDGAIEFIFIEGKIMIKDDFFENLIKTRNLYAKRCKIQPDSANSDLLDQVITKMEKNGQVSYFIHVKETIQIKKEAEKVGKKVRVWLPVPIEYAQVEDFKLIHTEPEATMINNPDSDHRCVYFEYELQENQVFSVEYSFVNHSFYQKLDSDLVEKEQPEFFIEEIKPHYVFSDYLVYLTDSVIGKETNPLLKAKKIYEYITSHVMYSYVRRYSTLPLIPEYVATSWKGDCGLQASLFITMCRIAHIPAQWQAGKYATPLGIGSHDWARFYVAPYGWLYADCSFGGSAYRADSKLRRDFYFGHLDPFRIPMAKEFQADLIPAKTYLRADPYDNQNGEIEYTDERIMPENVICNQEIIEIKEV